MTHAKTAMTSETRKVVCDGAFKLGVVFPLTELAEIIAQHEPRRRRTPPLTLSSGGDFFTLASCRNLSPPATTAKSKDLHMERAEHDKLIAILEQQRTQGSTSQVEVLRTKMELETANSQSRSAIASEQNAKYMFWSVSPPEIQGPPPQPTRRSTLPDRRERCGRGLAHDPPDRTHRWWSPRNRCLPSLLDSLWP